MTINRLRRSALSRAGLIAVAALLVSAPAQAIDAPSPASGLRC